MILEGPDGSGKTTLANELVKRGLAYGHCGAPTEPARLYYTRELRRHDGPAVIDRLHIGSYVYGKAFRNHDDLSDFDHWLLDGELWAARSLVVYCRPPDETIDTVLASRASTTAGDAHIYEEPTKQAEVRQLYDEYIAHRESLPVVTYDFTEPGAFDAVAMMASWWAGSGGSTFFRRQVPALGNTIDPMLILVGDQPASRPRALRRINVWGLSPARGQRYLQLCETLLGRFGSMWDSVSGRYLAGAMRATRLDWNTVCTFNSLQLCGLAACDFLDTAEVSRCGARVVALGRLASDQLVRAGIVHDVVPHPQHWRRFHYKDMTTYGRMLSGEVPWTGCDASAACRGGAQ